MQNIKEFGAVDTEIFDKIYAIVNEDKSINKFSNETLFDIIEQIIEK